MKIILAHRGVIKENKENTLSSLKAIKKYSNTTDIGFGVEFDINLTLDLQLILYHDECVKGTEKKITNLTYTELKSLDNELTLLEEVLDEFDCTDYILDIELKEYPLDKINFCNLFIELVNKYNQLNYFTSSFDKSIVEYLRNKNIISYQLVDKEDLISIGEINTIDDDENNVDDVDDKFIINYWDTKFVSKRKNVVGIYTLCDKNFINYCTTDNNYFWLKNILDIQYLITDDVDETIYLVK